MRIKHVSGRLRQIAMLSALAVGFALFVAACGSSDDNNNSGDNGGFAGGTGTQAASKCGLGNGKKATGKPIKLGAIVTKQPGTDFTDDATTAQAYFKCVNDNGGINGRPVQLRPDTEQTDPAQVGGGWPRSSSRPTRSSASSAALSIIECAVNHKY